MSLYELLTAHYINIPVVYWSTEFHGVYARVGKQYIASLHDNFLAITGFSILFKTHHCALGLRAQELAGIKPYAVKIA